MKFRRLPLILLLLAMPALARNKIQTIEIASGKALVAIGSSDFVAVSPGTNGQVLVADSTTSSGVNWSTISPITSQTYALRHASCHVRPGGNNIDSQGMTCGNEGAVSGHTPALTSKFASIAWSVRTSTAATNSEAGAVDTVSQPWLCVSSTAQMCGFRATWLFGISDAVLNTSARTLCGFHTAVQPVIDTAEPSALTDVLGVGHDSGDTTLQVMHNDGTGSATKINLGANFPTNTVSTDAYRVSFTAEAGSTDIAYLVERLNTGHTASGTITTNTPTALMRPSCRRTTGGSATAVSLNIGFFEAEQ